MLLCHKAGFLFCRALFAAVLLMDVVFAAAVPDLGREKFIGWEFDPAEHLAGVIRGRSALLLRNTEVKSGNQHLNVAYNLYNGE